MKIHYRKNYRVIVIPDEPLFLAKEMGGMTKENFIKIASNCEDIVNQIKRHIDGYIDVYQDFDSGDMCSFCEGEWEEDDDSCPVCCQEAVEEWEQKQKSTGK